MALDKEFLFGSHIAYSLSVHAAQSPDNPHHITVVSLSLLLSTDSAWWRSVTSPNLHNLHNNSISGCPSLLILGEPCVDKGSHPFSSPSFSPPSTLRPCVHPMGRVCPYMGRANRACKWCPWQGCADKHRMSEDRLCSPEGADSPSLVLPWRIL